MEEDSNIKLIQPPIALMVLPVIVGGIGIYYARKHRHLTWFKSVLVGVGGSFVGSIPSMFWAYNINKQYILQTEQEK